LDRLALRNPQCGPASRTHGSVAAAGHDAAPTRCGPGLVRHAQLRATRRLVHNDAHADGAHVAAWSAHWSARSARHGMGSGVNHEDGICPLTCDDDRGRHRQSATNTVGSPLLISGFGVQVPDGAPCLTCGFTLLGGVAGSLLRRITATCSATWVDECGLERTRR
jgi:hypothetical protein